MTPPKFKKNRLPESGGARGGGRCRPNVTPVFFPVPLRTPEEPEARSCGTKAGLAENDFFLSFAFLWAEWGRHKVMFIPFECW